MYENIIQNVSEEQVIELYTKDQIPDITKCNELITSLQLIETSSRHLDKELHKLCFDILPVLCVLLKHPLKAVSEIIWSVNEFPINESVLIFRYVI